MQRIPLDVSSGPGWKYDSNNTVIVVTQPNITLKNLDVGGGIEVKASNVIIDNVRVRQTGDWWAIGLHSTSNVTIEHSEIFSPYATGPNRLEVGIKDVSGDATGTRVIANNIYHASTGIQISAGLIQDNYLHDQGYNGTTDHLNGITSNAGRAEALTIRHNTILNDYGQTDAVSLFQDFGVQENAVVDNNYMAGGGYAIYAGSGSKGTSHNIQITNNVFSTQFFKLSGYWGSVCCYDNGGAGNIWSNNTWADGLRAAQAIPAP